MELAAQEPGGILNPQQTAEAFLCGAIRGDALEWPSADDRAFYGQLLDRAIANGLDCLLCHRLQATPAWQQLPVALRDQLEQRTRNAVAVEMARASDLRALHRGLADAGLGLLLLKGSALAYTHYPQPHLRARVDTDILVSPVEIRQVRAALEELGYRLLGWIYKSHQFSAARDNFDGRVIRYDVHWRANNDSRFARVIEFSEALRHSVEVPQLGSVRTLDPARALLLACMHRAGTVQRNHDRLNWVYDVHLLAGAMTAAERAGFCQLALRNGLQAVCLEALQSSRAKFGTDIPEDLLDALGAPVPPQSLRARFGASHAALLFDDFRLLPDRRSRLAFVREFFFPPADYLLNRYKKKSRLWLFPLYLRYLFGGLYERLALR